MNNALLLSLNPEANIADQWDYGFVKDLLEGRLWKTPNWRGFNIVETDFLPMLDSAVVVLPARHHAGMEEQVNDELWQIQNVVLFLLGDEEGEFDISKLTHKFMHVWVQNPHPNKHDKYNKLGTGYPQHIHKYLPKTPDKDLSVYFAGQITHKRRTALANVLGNLAAIDDTVQLTRTKGFTQGKNKADYYRDLASAKLAPAPSGAVVPDSFRLFEALECMAIPLADEVSPSGHITAYWDWLFGQITPYPKITDWRALYSVVPEQLAQWPQNVHTQTAWWIKYKRDFVYKVMEQLNGLQTKTTAS